MNHPIKNMSTKINRLLLGILCAAAFACLATGSRAATTTMSFQPNPVDLNDLDHHYSDSWRIDNLNLSNVSITSATLTFTQHRQLGQHREYALRLPYGYGGTFGSHHISRPSSE